MNLMTLSEKLQCLRRRLQFLLEYIVSVETSTLLCLHCNPSCKRKMLASTSIASCEDFYGAKSTHNFTSEHVSGGYTTQFSIYVFNLL